MSVRVKKQPDLSGDQVQAGHMPGRLRRSCAGLFFFIILLFTAVIPVHTVVSETLYYPQPDHTLQDTINMAATGDTVIVAPGTYHFYYDNLTVVNEFIIIKSSHGPEQTILSGRGKEPVVRFTSGSKAVLDGFTITGVPGLRGVDVQGGGIYCAPESAPVITNNIIKENNAVFGGGMYCDTLSAPVIENNQFVGNRASVSGGGVFSYRSSAIIRNNLFLNNIAANSGGAIGSNRDTSRINNNVLWKNRAGFGGGISCDRAASIIANNTIVENTAEYGGGIVVEKGSVRLTNLILWHNKKDDMYLKQVGPSARPAHSLIGDEAFRGMNGNISSDPGFVDMEKGDFHLSPGSPCIDTGSADPFYMDADGTYNDMGAYGGPQSTAVVNQTFSDKD